MLTKSCAAMYWGSSEYSFWVTQGPVPPARAVVSLA